MEQRFDLTSQDYVPPTRSHVIDSHRGLPHGGLLELVYHESVIGAADGPSSVDSVTQKK